MRTPYRLLAALAAATLLMSRASAGDRAARDLTIVQKPIEELTPDGEGIAVSGAVDHANGRYEVGDPVSLRIKVGEDSFVHVININPHGAATLLYPNAHSPGRIVRKGEELVLPASGDVWEIRADAQGRELIKVIATTSSLPLTADQATSANGPFRVFRAVGADLAGDLRRNLRGVELSRWGQASLVLDVVAKPAVTEGSKH